MEIATTMFSLASLAANIYLILYIRKMDEE